MKSTATSRLCSLDASSEPMSSSMPSMPSISPSTCGAVPAGLGDDLDGLLEVVGDVELVGVEQHGVPARVEALGDHVPVRAVVEVHATGTVVSRAIARNTVIRRSRP